MTRTSTTEVHANATRFELFDNGGKAGTRETHYRTPPARPATPGPFPHHAPHSTQPADPPHHCTKAHPLRSRVEEAPTLPPADRAAGRTSRGREAMEGRIERAPPPQLIHPDREFTTPLRSTPKLAAATRRMGEAAVEPPKQALRHPLAPR